MAETDDDDNAGRFLSLPAARAYLVEQCMGPPAYAELLLRTGLENDVIHYCEHEPEVRWPDRGEPRVQGRVLVPASSYRGAEFWRVSPFDDSSQVKIDWERSEATRIDHATQNRDGTWCEFRIVRKRGIRVSENDLKKVLQMERRRLPPITTVPLSSPPPPLTSREAARLDPKSWLVHAPDRFPEREGESREEYFKRVAQHMRRELKERAWKSAEYIGKKLYEFKLLPLRQPRVRLPQKPDKTPTKVR
jgi:hypothetical protein